MTETYLNSSVCGSGHLSHSPPITHACNHETLIIPESYTISVFDNSVKNVGTVWEQKLRLGGRASSRSLARRHGLIYGMEAGRFKYWAGGVVAPVENNWRGELRLDQLTGSRVGNPAQPKTFTRPLVVRLGSLAVFFIGGE